MCFSLQAQNALTSSLRSQKRSSRRNLSRKLPTRNFSPLSANPPVMIRVKRKAVMTTTTMRKKRRRFLKKVGCLLFINKGGSIGRMEAVNKIYLHFFIEDGEGVVDGSEDEDADDAGGEEEPEDEDEAPTETAQREAGAEEFEDKEHEAQFCLETNFMDEGGQEDTGSTAEHKDGKLKKIHQNSANQT